MVRVKSMKININEIVKVKLTDAGIEQLKNDSLLYNYHFKPETKILETELWDIMNIFGPKMYNGADQMFVNSEIILDKP